MIDEPQPPVMRKMRVRFNTPVQYSLRVAEEDLPLNDRIGRPLSLRFTGEIHCVRCGRRTSKSFAQGYCYPCLQESPECSPCIIRPELCRAHEGEGRDMDWEREHHLSEQVVYLADTGALKVGVTRAANLPTRWIDQGATRAVILAHAMNRHEAGLMEVALKAHISDRTNWRRMLTGPGGNAEALLATREALVAQLSKQYRGSIVTDATATAIDYPIDRYLEKVTSVGFDKEPVIAGTLLGIKGQYLMFEDGRVLNIRKHQGYGVEVEG